MGKLRFVDTFAGIGGFHLGVAQACAEMGIESECVKAVEFDDKACATYEANHGINPKGDMWQECKDPAFPEHDLLLGGFPCQPFSRNGKYYNKNNKTVSDGEVRAMLCFTLFEVLKARQPRMFIFENVKEIQSIRNSDGELMKDVVCDALKECGYDVEFKVLNSADFGLPQQRKRAYFVGILKGEDMGHELASVLEFPEKGRQACVKEILEDDPPEALRLSSLWKNRKVGKETKSLSQSVEWVRKHRPKSKYPDALGAAALQGEVTRLEALRLAYSCGDWKKHSKPTGEITPVAIIYGDTPSGLPRQMDKLYSVWGISPTIATFSTPSFDVGGDDHSKWRTLSPRECARLQGFPDGFVLPKSNSAAYKQVGNAVSVSVVKAVASRLLKVAWASEGTPLTAP